VAPSLLNLGCYSFFLCLRSCLPLQLGFIANQSGLQGAVKSASNPASSSYGKYPSLSTLQSKYGASSSKRKGVVNAFKSNGITAKVDVTHLRASATVSVGKAQKMFGTKWKVYKTSSGSKVALPVNTPKLPKGIKGNVDTVAGMRVQLSGGSSSAARAAVVADGGTPTRTGTPDFGCVPSQFPAALGSAGAVHCTCSSEDWCTLAAASRCAISACSSDHDAASQSKIGVRDMQYVGALPGIRSVRAMNFQIGQRAIGTNSHRHELILGGKETAPNPRFVGGVRRKRPLPILIKPSEKTNGIADQ